MAFSAVSKTTAGGCSFDMLCEGDNNRVSYACDNLLDLTEKRHTNDVSILNEDTSRLVQHVDDCIKSIEIGRGRQVEKFYIGKTHVHKKKKGKFSRMHSSTWRLSDGISKRFKAHRDKGYGRDGLVVLTLVTRKTIPSTVKKNRAAVSQELYAFALENRLIQHFLIERDDPRIVNPSVETGGRDGNKSIGYPLYMAFKLGDEEPVDSSDWDSSSESDSESRLNL